MLLVSGGRSCFSKASFTFLKKNSTFNEISCLLQQSPWGLVKKRGRNKKIQGWENSLVALEIPFNQPLHRIVSSSSSFKVAFFLYYANQPDVHHSNSDCLIQIWVISINSGCKPLSLGCRIMWLNHLCQQNFFFFFSVAGRGRTS